MNAAALMLVALLSAAPPPTPAAAAPAAAPPAAPAALPAAPADAVQALANKLLESTRGAIVGLRYTVRDDEGQEQGVEGMAVCIEAQKGIFLTMSIPNRFPLANIQAFRLMLPEAGTAELKADLLGIDGETGLAFLRCAEPGRFTAISFAPTCEVGAGEPVVSVGLLAQAADYGRIVGIARVAGNLRLPQRVVMVTGGTLANPSAPVYNLKGQAIGLAAASQTQPGAFFTPVDEFRDLLGNIPSDGKSRRYGWVGIAALNGLNHDEEVTAGFTDRAAVKVTSVIPGQPAEKAGVQPLDFIVGINGKPIERFASPAVTAANVLRTIAHMKPGDRVTLNIVRDKKPQDLAMAVEASPAPATESVRAFNKALGLGMRELTIVERQGRSMQPQQAAVLIDYVRQSGPAGQPQGLRAGDLLETINGGPVADAATFEKLMAAAMADKEISVQLGIVRGAQRGPVKISKPGAP